MPYKNNLELISLVSDFSNDKTVEQLEEVVKFLLKATRGRFLLDEDPPQAKLRGFLIARQFQ